MVRPTPDPPDPRVQHAGGRLDRDQQRLAVRPGDALDRQQVGVGVQVEFLLPAVGVERLAEIALGVQEADSDQRNAQVAGALRGGRRPARPGRPNRSAGSRAARTRRRSRRPAAAAEDRRMHRPPTVGVLADTRSAGGRRNRSASRGPSPRPAAPVVRPASRLRNSTGLWSTLRQRAGSSSRNSAITFGCHVHHRFRASSRSLSINCV